MPWLNLPGWIAVYSIQASNEGGERSGTTEHNWEGNGKEGSSVAAGQVQRSILKRLYGRIS